MLGRNRRKTNFLIGLPASLYPIAFHFHPVHLKLYRVTWASILYIPIPPPCVPLSLSKLIKSSHSHIVLLFNDTVYLYVAHFSHIDCDGCVEQTLGPMA